MAFTAKLYRNSTDYFDIAPALRVAPGEGFDPFDPDFIEPQFGDAPAAEGQPLLSQHYSNREMVFPLHINPVKYSLTATKDDLNDLLGLLAISAENPYRIEWADDGATASTWYDVVAARFEPEANFRRQQRNWMSGVLRVWVKPFGHTGTYRSLLTLGATTLPFIAPPTLAIVNGDVNALVDVDISVVASAGYTPQVAIGDTVATPYHDVPCGMFIGWGVSSNPSYTGWIPAPSLYAAGATANIGFSGNTPTSFLTGASGAAGSQVYRIVTRRSSGTGYTYFTFGLPVPMGGLDYGYNRVFALMRVATSGAASFADDSLVIHSAQLPAIDALTIFTAGIDSDIVFSQNQTFKNDCEWQPLEIGRIYRPTQSLGVGSYQWLYCSATLNKVSSVLATYHFDISGLVVLPEESSQAVFDDLDMSNNELISITQPYSKLNYVGTVTGASIVERANVGTYVLHQSDRFNFRAWGLRSGPQGFNKSMDSSMRGNAVTINPSKVQRPFAFAISVSGMHNHFVTAEFKVNERFTYQR